MDKQIQKFQLSTSLLTICIIATLALLFSSCKKKKEPPVPVYYTVIFDSQGGSEISSISGVKQDGVITLPPNPDKAGFTFDCWCTDKEGKNPFSPTTTINSDLTLYAKWIEQFYTVTFDSHLGSEVSPITGIKYGSTITLPPDPPVRAGYTFDGWHLDKSAFDMPFSPTMPITADLTLYAKWTN